MRLCNDRPTIIIFKSYNIIFSKIYSRLNLNDFQRHLSGVAEPMYMPQRDEGRFIFAQQENLFAVGYLGRAFDHNPMLSPMVVHLQTQAGARVHHDSLDLKALAAVDAVVPAPGSMNFTVGLGERVTCVFELVDDLFDVLGLIFVDHQNGVGGLYDRNIVQPHPGYQAAARQQQRVGATVLNRIAHMCIALRVVLAHLPQGVPGTQI